MKLLQNLEPGPRELFGRRHRLLTVPGGSFVVLAAAMATARGSTGLAWLVALPVILVAALGTLTAAMPSYRWFRRVGFGFLLVNGLLVGSLTLFVLGEWKVTGEVSSVALLVLVGWAVGSFGLLFVGGRRPVLEWRVATLLLGAHALVLGFFALCPHAPAVGSSRWIIVAGLALVGVGLVVWRLELAMAARATIPVARARR